MDEIYLSPVMHWLLRACWQASVMILLVLALQWIFRRQLTARWRYRLWFLVLVRLMLPMSPPSNFSLFNYFTLQSHPGLEQAANAIPTTFEQAGDLVPR